jgi:hypothetical protein
MREPPENAPHPAASDRLLAAGRAVSAIGPRLIAKSAFLLFGILVYLLVRVAVEGLPLAGQVVVLALVYIPLALLVYRLSKLPDATLAPFRRHGLAQPFMFVTGLWLAAIGWFSSLALVLVQRGVVEFHTHAGAAVGDTGRLVDFFVWQSFEQIPGLSINDTLQWDIPLSYGGGAGVVVMAFKLLILLPLVPVFFAAVRHRRPAADTREPAPPPPPAKPPAQPVVAS